MDPGPRNPNILLRFPPLRCGCGYSDNTMLTNPLPRRGSGTDNGAAPIKPFAFFLNAFTRPVVFPSVTIQNT